MVELSNVITIAALILGGVYHIVGKYKIGQLAKLILDAEKDGKVTQIEALEIYTKQKEILSELCNRSKGWFFNKGKVKTEP